MAAHSRLLWGRAATQGIVASAGLVQVHADGSQSPLWSTTSDDKEEQTIILAARRITSAFVLLGIGLACALSCTSARSKSVAGGVDEGMEERERLAGEDE